MALLFVPARRALGGCRVELPQLLQGFDAKFWGVVVMGGAVVILFFLPWLDNSPVKSIRYRPWHKYGCTACSSSSSSSWAIWASSRRRKSGTLVSQVGTLVLLRLLPAHALVEQLGEFKPVPERVTFARPLIARSCTDMMKKILASLLLALAGTAFAASGGVAWDKFPKREAVGHGGAAERRQAVRQLLPELPLAAFMRYNRLQGHRADRSADQGEPAVRHRQGRRDHEGQHRRQAGQGLVRRHAARPDADRALARRPGTRAAADYLYTYLRSYYRDETKATGWNNLAFPASACRMCCGNCRASASGVRGGSARPRPRPMCSRASEQVKPGTLNAAEFDDAWATWWPTCTWMGEPVQRSSVPSGCLGAALPGRVHLFAWRLNAAFWKDVK
jgi:ubiquinol-cytochrome c reductase cytochrome c1 subunit